jgi:nucleoside-triphosphatase
MSTRAVRLGLRGAPRVGKTTIVERLINLLRTSNVTVDGFVTREVVDGERVGFACHDLSGAHELIAHVDWASEARVGRYGVDVAAFERIALPALTRASGQHVAVIDEVGAMELLSAAFVRHLWELLDQPISVVMTMHSRPHPVTDELRARTEVEVVEVTPQNRSGLPEMVYARLRGSGHELP